MSASSELNQEPYNLQLMSDQLHLSVVASKIQHLPQGGSATKGLQLKSSSFNKEHSNPEPIHIGSTFERFRCTCIVTHWIRSITLSAPRLENSRKARMNRVRACKGTTGMCHEFRTHDPLHKTVKRDHVNNKFRKSVVIIIQHTNASA